MCSPGQRQFQHRAIFLLQVIIFLILAPRSNANKYINYTRFISKDPCELTCNFGFLPHTLCYEKHPIFECELDRFMIYDFEKFVDTDFRALLLDGHNGMRNRLAYLLNIANMAKMVWNVPLEKMARAYATHCTPWHPDECTSITYPLDFIEIYDFYKDELMGENFISQNHFCYKADYVPRYMVQMALSSWLLENKMIPEPTPINVSFVNEDVEIILLNGEHNYSHMVYPFSYLMGCAMARFDDHVCLFCNYYPYFANFDNNTESLVGEPTSECPFFKPMADPFYTHLCTGEIAKDTAAMHATHNVVMQIFGILLTTGILFYVDNI